MKRPFLRRRKLQAKRRSEAFTLPELLVGVVLGAVVLAALGGTVLVSQMRISTKIRTDIERRDALNRAIALMRSEIGAADRILIDSNELNYCKKPNLYLEFFRGQGKVSVCYNVQPKASILRAFRSDWPWVGECLLVRQGAVYSPNTGLLNTASNDVPQVVLDNMSSCSAGSTSLIVTPGQVAAGGSVLRDVDIEIRQVTGLNTTFSARVGSNPLFSSLTASPSNQVGPVCSWNSPQPEESMPKDCISNVYYFPKGYSSYQFQDDCTYSNCVVTDASGPKTYNKVDVLVFTDREIRP